LALVVVIIQIGIDVSGIDIVYFDSEISAEVIIGVLVKLVRLIVGIERIIGVELFVFEQAASVIKIPRRSRFGL